MIAALAMVALVAVLLLVLFVVLLLAGSQNLRRLGYKRQPNGTFTRVVGDVRVEYHPTGRWTVRTGLYAASDFVAEPKKRRKHGEYAFECGVEALDARFWFWSERPPFAKLLLGEAAVYRAMLAFPAATVISLHGDELVVQVKRRHGRNHERVVRLARAIAEASRPP